MGRVAEDLQPEIDRLRPSPRRDTWLAFDSTNDAPGKDIHAIGLLKAHTTGTDYLDPATADFPDGADRPPHEPTTRAMARRLYANGTHLFVSDSEGWWCPCPDYPEDENSLKAGHFGDPLDAAKLQKHIDWHIRVHSQVRAECPGIWQGMYGVPPINYYRTTDDQPGPGWTKQAIRAQRDSYNRQLSPLLKFVDVICLSAYDFGNDDEWERSTVLRIEQCRALADKPVLVFVCAFKEANPALGLLSVATIKHQWGILRANADGGILWGWSPWHSRPHVDAIRAAVN